MFREVTNRLLRRGLQRGQERAPTVELPMLPGRPRIDVRDVSAVLAEEDDEHVAGKGQF